MPPKRRTRKRKGFYYHAGNALNIAHKALSTANQVKKLLNVEFKRFRNTATTSTTSAGTVVPLTDIQQGTDYNERDGNSVKLKSVSIKGWVRHNASGDPGQVVRVIIVMDTQMSAGSNNPPLVNEILQGADVISHKNIRYKDRFWFLYDRCFSVTGTGGLVYAPFEWYRKLNVQEDFISDSAEGDNALYMLLIGTQTTTGYPDTDWESEVLYLDN